MKSIFMGKVLQEEYELEYKDYYVDNNFRTYFKNFEKFYECELERLPLQINEMFYIDELNIRVKILNATRSVNNYYIYECDIVIRTEIDPEKNEKKEIKDKENKRLYEKRQREDNERFEKWCIQSEKARKLNDEIRERDRDREIHNREILEREIEKRDDAEISVSIFFIGMVLLFLFLSIFLN
jgi:hypothetical protein